MDHSKLAIILCVFIIHSFTFMSFSFGLDRIFPNQTIGLGQTLVSPNQMFEIGFFSPGSSKNIFLGLWYKDTPDVIAWIANRNNPITDSQGLHLAIVENTSVAIIGEGRMLWSSNSSQVVSNPILQLLNTGNLVLADNSTDERDSYIWQSFDHPTDTLLPGMKLVDDVDAGVHKYLSSWKSSDDPSPGDVIGKIHNQGLPDLVLFKGTKKIFRTGTWNGQYFSGLSPFPNENFQPELLFKKERLISFLRPYNKSTFRRSTLDKSGSSIRVSVLNARKDEWNPIGIHPQFPCEEYGKCGPFGVYTLGIDIICQCFKGFTPKFPKDWDLQDWSGGCTRITQLDFQTENHGFLEVTGINYPDLLQYWLNTSMSLDECKDECLKNCSCIAYANPYIVNGGSGCLMWFGELLDTRYLPTADKHQKIYVRLPRSELGRTKEGMNKAKVQF